MKMNKFRVFATSVLLVVVVIVGFFANRAIPARAFGPSVLFSPTSSCSASYCDLYPKSVQLANGTILVAFEDDTQPTATQTFPIYSSTNNGATWSYFSSVPYSGPRRGWVNWTNPFFYTLPQAIGTMPAGTLLLAGIAAPPDRSATAVVLYSSTNNGLTWKYVSEVASGGGKTGSNLTPIWEPNLLVANNKLIVYYSDERDKAHNNQKLVHQTSTDGVTWGSVVNDVAPSDTNLRPGMAVVAKMANGQYIMTYEVVNLSGTPNNFKISSNPESWNPTDLGTTIDYGGSPFITSLPNGRLAYNSYGSGNILINTNNGSGAWTSVLSNMPKGYSRTLQYVTGTGRVLILSCDGFWVSGAHPIYYGDVDLGYSVGAYYKLVNRKSGQVLDVSQSVLTDGAQAIQWPDYGGASQLWHVTNVGSGNVELLNENSGRTLAITQAGTTNGALAIQWVENNGNEQKWQFVAAGSYYKIKNVNSGKLLSVLGGSMANGAEIVQWDDVGTLDQQWSLVQVS
jgi:hypothetical protein